MFKRRVLASSSLLVLAALPGAALANCSPNPAQAYVTTTCAGVETNGLSVGQSEATVNVNAGASVSSSNPNNSAVTIESSSQAPNQYFYPTLSDSGTISGGTQAGVLVYNDTGAYSESNVNITVASGGVIQGGYGVLVSGTAATSPYYGNSVEINNSGVISGSTGAALYAGAPSFGYFSSITNLAGGQIGGVVGAFNTLSNAGVINGGAASAITNLAPVYYYYGVTVTNSTGGLIVSNSAAAALILNTPAASVTNAGTITNSGGGAAIYAANGLDLVNLGGVINGAIIANGSNSDTIDDTGGVINGSITLGSGQNFVIAGYGGTTNPIDGISGSIISGGGDNTLQLNITSNTTLTSLIAPPAPFQTLAYGVGGGAALTLAAGAQLTSTLYLTSLSGGGKVVNDGNINTTGPAFAALGYNYNDVAIVNNGQITSRLTNGDYAIMTGFVGLGDVTNNGAITAIGGGGLIIDNSANITNSGTVTADGDALNVFDAVVVNSGTLHSNYATGFYGFGNEGTLSTNSGAIYGQIAGAELLGYTLKNSGTITSPGVGVSIDPYGTLINESGGIINGGVGSILYNFTFEAEVINAGTINGDVNFGFFPSYYGSGNKFIAEPGSIVNGNLVLGGGYDNFATSLNNTGPGEFAGVTGTVTGDGAGTDILRYLVTSNATTTASLPPLFGALAYDLSGGATLTLTASSPAISAIGFSGTGTVNLTANLTGTSLAPVLDLTQTSYQTEGASAQTVPTALNFTSNGTLVQTHTNIYAGAQPAVRLNGSSIFTNAGRIVVEDTAQSPYYYNNPLAAIAGSGTVINTGTISVSAADGVYGNGQTLTVINSGLINQLVGVTDSQGVVNASSVTNTGTISTGGTAVTLGAQYNAPATLTNSGTIQSTDAPAVTSNYLTYAVITNEAGGTISGPTSLSLSNAALVANAGALNGDVTIGYNSYYYGTDGVYINQGGTLNGNLTFNTYNNIFVPLNGVIGVTGAVNGGSGVNTIGLTYTTTSTVTDYAYSALVTGALQSLENFQNVGIGAVGAGVTVTVANAGGALNFAPLYFGNGMIINDTNVASNLYSSNVVQLGLGNYGPYSSLNFINNAQLADGVTGVVSDFANNGAIGSTTLGTTAVTLSAGPGSSFSFNNTGAIATNPVQYYEYYNTPVAISISNGAQGVLNNANINNGGKIIGGLSLSLLATDFSFENTGTISGDNNNATIYYPGNDGVTLSVGEYVPQGSQSLNTDATLTTLSNSGAINNGFSATIASNTTQFANSGAINLAPGASPALSLTITGNQTYDVSQGVNGVLDQASLTVVNSGVISGAVSITSQATSVSVTNSGAVTTAPYTQSTPTAVTALSVNNTTSQAQTVSVANSGSVTSQNLISPALYIGATSTLSTVAVTVSNSGVLRADAGSILYPATTSPAEPANLTLNAALAVVATSPSASSVTVTNAAGGLLSSIGPLTDGSTITGTTLSGSTAGQGSVALFASADTINIVNSGQIDGGAGLTLPAGATGALAGQTAPLPDQYLAGAIQTIAAKTTVTNTAAGVINGSIDLGAGGDTISNYGAINGDVYLRGSQNQLANGGLIAGSISFASAGVSSNTLILQTGSVLGGAVAGSTVSGSTNALVLQGAGVLNSSIINFNTLTVAGSGVWVLDGNLSAPVTTITAGDLEIGDLGHPGATLTSAVTVDAGGVLSGHGTIVGDVINNGGTVSPGGSIGVLTIQGDYTQSPKGVLSLQVTPQAASALNVTGAANLAGELLLVTDSGVYRKGQMAALITAGSIAGGFTSVVASDGLKLGLSFQNGQGTADFLNSNFATLKGSSNQNAIGAAFGAYPVGVSDFDPVANALIALPAGARQNTALDALGGEVDADFLTVGRDSMRMMLNSVTDQQSDIQRSALDGRSTPARTVWGTVFGQFGTINSDEGGHGFNSTVGGGVVGVQYETSPQTSLGAAVSYSHTDFSLRDLAQSGGFDAGSVAIESEHRWGGLFIDGAASIAYDRGSSLRHIDFTGVGRKATGGFDGYSTGLWVGAGWRVKTSYGVVLEPSVSIALSRVRRDGLTEAGATGADLSVAPQAQGAAQSTVGVRISKTFQLKRGGLSVEGRLAETNEQGAVRPYAQESFTAAPGTNFAVTGANPGRDATVAEFGATYRASDRVSVFSRFQSSFSPRQTDNSVNLGGRINW